MNTIYSYAGMSFAIVDGERFEMAEAISRFGFSFLAGLPVVWL